MLHVRRLTNAIGLITRLYSLAFVVPAASALIYDAYDDVLFGIRLPLHALIFALVGLLAAGFGTALIRIAGDSNKDLGNREAYVSVGLGWMLLCLFTSLPYMLGGTLPVFMDAFFEAMSGLTTTGASVVSDLEAVDPSIHVWRTFTQFLGGMGIIVLSVAILSRLTQGGLQMLQAEVPGPTLTRSTPRIAQAMRSLWRVYLGLFGFIFAALLLDLLIRHDMNLKQAVFEAMIHAFATVSTGGFSSHSASIAYFDDAIFEAIVIIGMLAAGTNFALILTGKQNGWKRMRKDGELRLYGGIFVGVVSTVIFLLVRNGGGGLESIRDASFVIASLMTSTGFGTADYVQWPDAAQLLILFVMVGGAMAGSTSGGMKLVRIMLLCKMMAAHIKRALHPRAEIPVRVNGKPIKEQTMMAVAGFFFSFIALWVIGTLLLGFVEPAFGDLVTASSAALSALSNVGPGLGAVGPSENFSGFTMATKGIFSALMWIGRLEIFTAIILFLPETWRH